MSEEIEVQKLIPIDEQITQELVKHNVTEAVITGLKEKYGHLKIAGIDDKETYDLVKTGRKECKAFRVLAKKICEKGREDAVAIQKAWVGKQKEVTDLISEIEEPLEKQEKEFEAAVTKDKEDRKRKQEEQLIIRQQMLSAMGVLYSDGNFTLGKVSFELSLVKECEPDIWEETILPKFKEEYEKVEAERIEQEREKAAKEAEIKSQIEQLEKEKQELQRQRDEIKKAQEEREKIEYEEATLKAAQERERIEQLWRGRLEKLRPIGWNGQEAFARYDESVVVATYEQLIHLTDDGFNAILNEHMENVTADAQQKEKKRLAEIEAQKEAERKRTLGRSRGQVLIQYGANFAKDFTEGGLALLTDEDWDVVCSGWQSTYEQLQKEKWEKEQADKRAQEELIRVQKLDSAKDKEKWEEMMQKINEVVVYEMRSSQYRKKAMIMREKLEEIKAL